jgi:hypothetical protein
MVGAGAPEHPPVLLDHVPIWPLPDHCPLTVLFEPMVPVAVPETESTGSLQFRLTLFPEADPSIVPDAAPAKAPLRAPVVLTTKFQVPEAVPMYVPQKGCTAPWRRFSPAKPPVSPVVPSVNVPDAEPPPDFTWPEIVDPSVADALKVAEACDPVHVPVRTMAWFAR